jgi:hypothetical protein
MRVTPAMSLARSMRQTASMARCVSAAVMAADHNTLDLAEQARDGPG